MPGEGAPVTTRWSTPGSPVCTPDWLALREPADAAARATELVEPLRAHLPDGPLVVRDLGCGTGSMGRWLAPLLPNAQHWILHDRDEALLERAARSLPAGVTTGTRGGDLTAARLSGASLVTASALLDLLTAEEVEAIAAVGCPALLTLSVVGRVSLSPADPLDADVAAAFDAHQRRTVDGRRLLGPDAVSVAAGAFRRRGAHVVTVSSPWRLGPGTAELAEEWLRGWVAAAVEQRPDLDGPGYLHRRLDALAAGDLSIVVGHADLIALPRSFS